MDLISKEDNVGQSTYKWTVIYESGEIVEYADFDKTYELYQGLQNANKPDNSRQRAVSSRGMQRSSSSTPVAKPRTAGWDGWKQDLGVQ